MCEVDNAIDVIEFDVATQLTETIEQYICPGDTARIANA